MAKCRIANRQEGRKKETLSPRLGDGTIKETDRRNGFKYVLFPTFFPEPSQHWPKTMFKKTSKRNKSSNFQKHFRIQFKESISEWTHQRWQVILTKITQRDHRIAESKHQSREENHLSTKVDRFHIDGNGVVWILHGRGSPVSESPKPRSLSLSLLFCSLTLSPRLLREKEALASMAYIRSDFLSLTAR